MLDVDFQVSHGKEIKLTCLSYFEFLFFPYMGCHFLACAKTQTVDGRR